MKQKRIRYAIDTFSGLVVSHNMLDNTYAWPVLDYDNMTVENGYKEEFYLEKITMFEVLPSYDGLIFTRKISNDIKNTHRKFWGMKPL